jgi:putative ABC transport system permease protein
MSNASAISRTPNRAMFWRIVRRQLTANRGRLFVVLLALAAGAAITAALLNLQIDAKRRLGTEFSAFGANAVLAPRNTTAVSNSLDEMLFNQLPAFNDGVAVTKAELLYGIVDAGAFEERTASEATKSTKAVVVGFAAAVGKDYIADGIEKFSPSSVVAERDFSALNVRTCQVGQRLATQLHLEIGSRFSLRAGTHEDACAVSEIRNFGGPGDGEIFFELPATQALLGFPGRVSAIEVRVPGTPQSIERYIAALQAKFPETDVHAIRPFSVAQGEIYSKISGLLTATVVLVLVLTALCVMAAMTNVAMERRNDVGLMKAIGGARRRVLRLFLTEAALLGLAGGLLGAAIGIALSVWLGEAVFGIAARARLIVYPISVALTIIVAIASSYPLRRLASVRPASVFRGEA